MANPRDGTGSDKEQRACGAAGFAGPTGLGKRPAMLIADEQYRTVGTTAKPLWDAIKQFPTTRGEISSATVANISRRRLALFRERDWPVLYPLASPKESPDNGRLSDKVPAIMSVAARGYEFVKEIARTPKDILLPKKHPSAFFATPRVSYLINAGTASLVVTGCATSGSVAEGFADNVRVLVPHDGVHDRRATSHGEPVRYGLKVCRRDAGQPGAGRAARQQPHPVRHSRLREEWC